MVRLGVDTGGTFTDFVWLDDNGRFHIHKQFSTPQDPSAAILSGIKKLALPADAEVVHGSTVATNALLERRGARTALITTSGFTDILAIGRQNRPDLYALVPQKPAPLVPKAWRFGVQERVTADGDILIPLDADSLMPILPLLVRNKIESVAICLLFSFLHPEHEQSLRTQLQTWMQIEGHESLFISLSSEILPEYREYERTATTVINAYVAPLMSRYLARLAAGLGQRRLTVMQSNGGVISAQTAGAQAARTALSGPAGGVVGARFVAAQAGFENLITFDMGGTSTDVALCPGSLPTTSEGEIAGLPLRLPIIDIHTVGAGGGSVAYVDAGGALHVGPKSTGAEPGPACYGRQPPNALQPTVTDANLVLGRLDAANFLGGHMQLQRSSAHAALTQLAAAMGVETAVQAAWGVLQVANANMERAIRRISVERGHDPRLFTLIPFGGAGPLHACELAQNLQIPRILLPPVPGVLSALVMLAAQPTKDYSLTVLHSLTAATTDLDRWLQTKFEPLMIGAKSEMHAEGYVAESLSLNYSLDMRYVGQSHELTIQYLPDQTGDIVADFNKAHAARYGYLQAEAALEIVTLRLTAVAPVTPPQLQPNQPTGADFNTAIIGQKQVWFEQRPLPTMLIDRDKLQPGHRFYGPAIVFQYDTTTVVAPGWETAVDPYGNLVLTKERDY